MAAALREMGVLLQKGVHVVSGSFDHGAMSCGQTPLKTGIVPMSFDHQQSKYVDTARATDWLIRLLCRYVGGM